MPSSAGSAEFERAGPIERRAAVLNAPVLGAPVLDVVKIGLEIPFR